MFFEGLSSLYDNFTCGLGGFTNISYCSDSVTFDLTTVSNYDPFCVVGKGGCVNISCEYGDLSRMDYETVCANNVCRFGTVNYFQVSEYTAAHLAFKQRFFYSLSLSLSLSLGFSSRLWRCCLHMVL